MTAVEEPWGTHYWIKATSRKAGAIPEILPFVANDTFCLYAGIWFACAEAKESWRIKSRESKQPALERRWMFWYAFGESFRVAYRSQGVDLSTALQTLSSPACVKQDASDKKGA